MTKLPDDVWEQINRLLEDKDRADLAAKYDDAQRREDWKLAHNCLLELACRALRSASEGIAEVTKQDAVNRQRIKVMEGRLDRLEAL